MTFVRQHFSFSITSEEFPRCPGKLDGEDGGESSLEAHGGFAPP